MLGGVMAAYAWAVASGRGEVEVRGVAFAAIVLGNLALIYSMRSRTRTVAQTLREPNAAGGWIALGALGALAAVLYLPAAAALFRVAPLGAAELAVAVAAGCAGVLGHEAWKLARGAATRAVPSRFPPAR